ncbi:hypothetical protein G7Y89_g9887 [Cudoniella acicularis]|uniref:Uncharacterized protein n=1 Tax=Cudoniella acicularis TaxID=354080 RepID=A0A8H4RDT7_9HELO|nr:hypothetical protein G7Y89_g9887 [Cudoniella acicularis]
MASCDGETRINPSIPFHQPSKLLEELPTELQRMVLHASPTLGTLQSLVLSSPLYHQAYVSSRKSILSTVLRNELGSVWNDAAARLRGSKFPSTSDPEDDLAEITLIVNYEVGSKFPTDDVNPCDLPTLIEMARFHWKVLHIMSNFCKHSLLFHPLHKNVGACYQELSPSESRRIYRALYRLEIFCSLFEFGGNDRGYETSDYDGDEVQDIFLGKFGVWEIEEIACLRDYFYRYYYSTLETHIRQRREFADTRSYTETAESCVSLGLERMYELMTSTRSLKARLLDEMIDDASNIYPQLTRALQNYGNRLPRGNDDLDAHTNKNGMNFLGENEGPNVAWVWSVNNTFDMRYYHDKAAHLRFWGYVMWDLNRLEEWGILKLKPEDFKEFHVPEWNFVYIAEAARRARIIAKL